MTTYQNQLYDTFHVTSMRRVISLLQSALEQGVAVLVTFNGDELTIHYGALAVDVAKTPKKEIQYENKN